MSKAKTRIVATVDGQDRELFSVRQTTGGDLLITCRGEENYRLNPVNDGPFVPVVENRVSVHRSLKSIYDATSIKHTVATEDGHTHTHASFVKDSRLKLLWPAFGCWCSDLRSPRYDLNKKPRDTLIRIADDIPRDSSFVFHAYVAGLQRQPVALFQCRVFVARFRFFNIHIYTNYVNVPTGMSSFWCSIPTSAAQRDNQPIDATSVERFTRAYSDGADSISDDDLGGLIHHQNEHLLLSYANDIKQLTPPGDRLHAWIDHHPPLYTQYPLSSGRPVRITNPLPLTWNPPNKR